MTEVSEPPVGDDGRSEAADDIAEGRGERPAQTIWQDCDNETHPRTPASKTPMWTTLSAHTEVSNADQSDLNPARKHEENTVEWFLGAVGGLLGGNAAGTNSGQVGLGVAGNSAAGALGGLLGGGLGGNLLSGVGDIAHIVGSLGGGGVGGAVLTAIVGAVLKGRNNTNS